jgi:hypothetical protein
MYDHAKQSTAGIAAYHPMIGYRSRAIGSPKGIEKKTSGTQVNFEGRY